MSYAYLPWLHRHGLLLAFLGSLLIVAAAVVYEKVTGLLPCPLCWIQRWIFILLGLVSLLAWLLQKIRWTRWLFALLHLAVAVLGIGVAARHIYIKMHPEFASCGMDVQTLLDFFPLLDALLHMLKGSADCAQAADLLWLPLPAWSLLGYVLLTGLALWRLLWPAR